MAQDKHWSKLIALAEDYLSIHPGDTGRRQQAWLALDGECYTPAQADRGRGKLNAALNAAAQKRRAAGLTVHGREAD